MEFVRVRKEHLSDNIIKMEIIIIAFSAAFASLLTFFSGFGLGTILTPVFMVFFPIEIAIALTGIVHLLNNIFKMVLIGKNANWKVVVKFGIPAILAAFLGAKILMLFTGIPEIASYTIGEKTFLITPVKLIISLLLICFSLFEIIPYFKNLQFKQNKLYIGGLLSGFFGGLSGHQGALRSAFLIRCGLSKEGFIATGVFIASIIDITRLSVYFTKLPKAGIADNIMILSVAVCSAFIGAYFGKKLLNKITIHVVQLSVSVMIMLLAIALGTGLI